MKKILLILSLIFSFNVLADCNGSPVLRGGNLFCYEALPLNYASLEEINLSFSQGPIFPGWEKGMITQLRDAMEEILEKNHERAVEIISEVYAQNQFLIGLEKKWSKRRLLKKAKPFMENAIFHLKSFWPRKGKLQKLLNKAIYQIERYAMKK